MPFNARHAETFGFVPGFFAAVDEDTVVSEPQMGEVGGGVTVGGGGEAGLSLTQRRKTTRLLHSLTIRRRQSAVETVAIPTHLGTNGFVKAELTGDGRDVEVRAGAHEYEIVAAALVLGHFVQRIGEGPARDDIRDETCRPGIDIGAAAATESGFEEGFLDGAFVAAAEEEIHERRDDTHQQRYTPWSLSQ